jgi:hypothetical protein
VLETDLQNAIRDCAPHIAKAFCYALHHLIISTQLIISTWHC